MLRLLDEPGPRIIALKLSGKLHDEDYDRFVPLIEKAVAEQGRTRMLLLFDDFYGWNPHALWDDIAFEAAHHDRIARYFTLPAWFPERREAGGARARRPIEDRSGLR